MIVTVSRKVYMYVFFSRECWAWWAWQEVCAIKKATSLSNVDTGLLWFLPVKATLLYGMKSCSNCSDSRNVVWNCLLTDCMEGAWCPHINWYQVHVILLSFPLSWRLWCRPPMNLEFFRCWIEMAACDLICSPSMFHLKVVFLKLWQLAADTTYYYYNDKK